MTLLHILSKVGFDSSVILTWRFGSWVRHTFHMSNKAWNSINGHSFQDAQRERVENWSPVKCWHHLYTDRGSLYILALTGLPYSDLHWQSNFTAWLILPTVGSNFNLFCHWNVMYYVSCDWIHHVVYTTHQEGAEPLLNSKEENCS